MLTKYIKHLVHIKKNVANLKLGNCWSIVGWPAKSRMLPCSTSYCTPANISPHLHPIHILGMAPGVGGGGWGVLQTFWPEPLPFTLTRWSPAPWPSPYEGWMPPIGPPHHRMPLAPIVPSPRPFPVPQPPRRPTFGRKPSTCKKEGPAMHWMCLIPGSGGKLAASHSAHPTSPFPPVAPTRTSHHCLRLCFDFHNCCFCWWTHIYLLMVVV